VLEAVKHAMSEAKHPGYAPNAIESAIESAYHRPEQILEALRRLDQLAEGLPGPERNQVASR
jgi:hypothetical protein